MYPGFYNKCITSMCIESVRSGNLNVLKYVFKQTDKVDTLNWESKSCIPLELPLFAILFGYPELYNEIRDLFHPEEIVKYNNLISKITHLSICVMIEYYDSITYSATNYTNSIIFTTSLKNPPNLIDYFYRGKLESGAPVNPVYCTIFSPDIRCHSFHQSKVALETKFLSVINDFLPISLSELCCEYLIETFALNSDCTPGLDTDTKTSFISIKNSNPIYYLRCQKYYDVEDPKNEIFYNKDINVLRKYYNLEIQATILKQCYPTNHTLEILINGKYYYTSNEIETSECIGIIFDPNFIGTFSVTKCTFTLVNGIVTSDITKISYKHFDVATDIYTFGKFYI